MLALIASFSFISMIEDTIKMLIYIDETKLKNIIIYSVIFIGSINYLFLRS